MLSRVTVVEMFVTPILVVTYVGYANCSCKLRQLQLGFIAESFGKFVPIQLQVIIMFSYIDFWKRKTSEQ